MSDEKQKDEKAEVAPGADLEPIAIADDEGLDAEERARREADAEERARREAEATAEVAEPEPVDRPARKLGDDVRVQGTGKRKNAVARVLITAGDGTIKVNGRSLESYVPRAAHQAVATQPLAVTGYESAVSVQVRVHGGGVSGQAGAVRHGIARALCEVDGELRGDLKRRGFLTRDARVKERRKAGLKKARKRPQFSKR